MKYPQHLILDMQPSFTSFNKTGWGGEFTRLLSPSKLRSVSRVSPALTAGSKPSLVASRVNLRPSMTSTFDIHLLRKEKLYTKLKYSRCPQYDIVSGGFAAIFAGFIGFLISEKFGIELVDSGDFYTAFMYGVFATFMVRPLLRIYSEDNTPYHPLSLKYLLIFCRDLFLLVANFLKKGLSHFTPLK